MKKKKVYRRTSKKATSRKGKYTKPNIWDKACELTLMRHSGCPGMKEEKLDPGVNFFVLMLEKMGIRTFHSCEGHPDGFYITFDSTYRKAIKIKRAGYFSVEIERNGGWSIRLNREQKAKEHVDCLRWAAEAWAKHLFPLKLLKQKTVAKRGQKTLPESEAS